MNTYVHESTWFIAALCVKAKTWKQPNKYGLSLQWNTIQQ